MNGYSEICHCCFGRGYLVGEGEAECPYCNGSGWVACDDEEYEDEDDAEVEL